MSDVMIQTEGLGKQFRIGARERYQSLRDVVAEKIRSFGRGNDPGQPPHIWALKDVSLEVRKGEVLGIIGHNGAGKTTLLKILSRITKPTQGWARIRGRVGSLLEVGTGFHPELTGRDNVYLSGAILGMSRQEIRRKFDEIIQFSGVDSFIDTPMKRYSSGMQVRLAFSIAAHLEPEVFLIDEVLAVGDLAFQEKCIGKMSKVAAEGRTVLFVSHNMGAIRSLCSSVVLLEAGSVRMKGKPDEVIQAYTGKIVFSQQKENTSPVNRKDRSGSGRVRVVSVEAIAPTGQNGIVRTNGGVDFVIGYAAAENMAVPQLTVTIGITTVSGASVFGCSTSMSSLRSFRNLPPVGFLICRVKNLPLMPGKYWITIWLKVDLGAEGIADFLPKAGSFTVIDDGASGFFFLSSGQSLGSVVVPHSWECCPEVAPLTPQL